MDHADDGAPAEVEKVTQSDEQKLDSEGPCCEGPIYEEGDGRVCYLGWLDNDGSGVAGFRAVIEFPHGPPSLPLRVVWDGTPIVLSLKPHGDPSPDR